MVPMFTCGLLRSNFSLAIFFCPLRQILLFQLQTLRRWFTKFLERGTGFEPATITLEEGDSTVELPPPTCDIYCKLSVPHDHLIRILEPGTGIEPVTSSLPRTRSTN